MSRRVIGAALAVLLVAAVAIAGCSSDEGSGGASGVPRGELPEGGMAVMYEFYTDS